MEEVASALAVIQRAIHDEVAGQRFYSDASFYCIDPWAKDLFGMLAREEEKHTQLLLVEYDSLATEGGWIDPDTVLLSEVEVDITRFTFDDDGPTDSLFPLQSSMAETVDRRADDLTALSLGIQMEQKAIAVYTAEAMRSTDPAARKAYQFLVSEESRHYQQLKDRWEDLAGVSFVET